MFLDALDLLDELSEDCPTLRFVPSGARAAAAQATEALCKAALRAPRGSLAEERAWKLLLLRERLLFAAPLRFPQQGRARRRDAQDERQDLGRLVRESTVRVCLLWGW